MPDAMLCGEPGYENGFQTNVCINVESQESWHFGASVRTQEIKGIRIIEPAQKVELRLYHGRICN